VQALELVRIQRAANDEAQAIRDEDDHVVVFENLGILQEERALLGILQVRFDRQEAILAHLHEDVVDEFEQRHVLLAAVTRAFRQRERL